MAKFVLKDAEIVINAVDLSAWVNAATLDINPDLPEATPRSFGEFRVHKNFKSVPHT